MALVLQRNRRAAAMRILVTESIAQEGIDFLRTRLPDAQIDVRLNPTAEQLRAMIGPIPRSSCAAKHGSLATSWQQQHI